MKPTTKQKSEIFNLEYQIKQARSGNGVNVTYKNPFYVRIMKDYNYLKTLFPIFYFKY